MAHKNPLPALPCACAALRRAARAVTQLYDEALRPAGLRVTQFTILQVLSLSERAIQGSIGEILAIDATTLTRNLKLLEEEGWIASRPGKDRRERLWKLTAAGRRRLEGARPRWETAQARFREGMREVGWEEFMRVADAAASAARRGEDATG